MMGEGETHELLWLRAMQCKVCMYVIVIVIVSKLVKEASKYGWFHWIAPKGPHGGFGPPSQTSRHLCLLSTLSFYTCRTRPHLSSNHTISQNNTIINITLYYQYYFTKLLQLKEPIISVVLLDDTQCDITSSISICFEILYKVK